MASGRNNKDRICDRTPLEGAASSRPGQSRGPPWWRGRSSNHQGRASGAEDHHGGEGGAEEHQGRAGRAEDHHGGEGGAETTRAERAELRTTTAERVEQEDHQGRAGGAEDHHGGEGGARRPPGQSGQS